MSATTGVTASNSDPPPIVQSRGAAAGLERAFGAAAAKTSLTVGTVLMLINHPQVLHLELTPGLLVPLAMNYAVPFLVSGYSRHRLLRTLGAASTLGQRELSPKLERAERRLP